MTLPLVHRRFDSSPALHYVEGPDNGPPLLLLHGVTRNWTDWQELLPELQNHWRVIALDQRGHGLSERKSGSYRVIDYAQDAAAFVQSSFNAPVTVVGHSLGAMVALWLAAECGDRVANVVLEDPPFHTMGRQIAQTPYLAQFLGMHDIVRSGCDDIELLTDMLCAVKIPTPQGLVELGQLRDRESLQYGAECLRQVDADIFTPLIAGQWLDGFDYETLWSRVKCPALLLQGDSTKGGAFTDADVTLARQKLSKYELMRFVGVGHQIHRTCPHEFIAALLGFVPSAG